MRILVTNDDGIHAPGLDACEAIAREIGDEVFVVAPESDQSGLSHSLTMSDPLRMRRVSENRYAVRGTPGDCVIMAVRKILDRPPDLVLSGVNRGQNAADDITYSGTVAAAIEATMLGIKAVALSQAYRYDTDNPVPWETARAFGPKLVKSLLGYGFPRGILYNVNFPNRKPDAVTGTRTTVQGRREHGLQLDERVDGRGNPYFWLMYRRPDMDAFPGSDLAALLDGAISVTPLHLDFTAHALADSLAGHLGGEGDG